MQTTRGIYSHKMTMRARKIMGAGVVDKVFVQTPVYGTGIDEWYERDRTITANKKQSKYIHELNLDCEKVVLQLCNGRMIQFGVSEWGTIERIFKFKEYKVD